MRQLNIALVTVLLLLLAWGMFVVGLDRESMRTDEDYSWRISAAGPLNAVQETVLDVHPPAFYLVLAGWIGWTGSQNLFIMRLLTAIIALLTTAFVYRLSRDWFDNHWVGWGAALFLATSGVFAHHAGNLRMYTLGALLACASWWLLWRWLHGKGWLGYALILGLMAYTHYALLLVALAQWAYVLLAHRDQARGLLRTLALAGLAFLPWLPSLLGQLETIRAQTGRDEMLVAGPLAMVPTSVDSIVEFFTVYSASQPAFVLLLIGLALFSPTVFRRHPWLGAVLIWFFGTAFLFFALNPVVPLYSLTYILPVLPALALLVGMALHNLRSQWQRVGVLCLIGLIGFSTHTQVYRDSRPPHRDILQTIERHYQPGDKIWYNLSFGALGSSLTAGSDYHLRFDTPSLDESMFVWDAPHDYAEADRVWDVRPYWVPVPDAAAGTLEAGRVVSTVQEFGAYILTLYDTPPTPATDGVILGGLFEMVYDGPPTLQAGRGETIDVPTWWRDRQPVETDYSYALYLRAADGTIIAQHDAGLLAGEQATSAWNRSRQYALGTLRIDLPANLIAGDYSLWLGVYDWQNPDRLEPRPAAGYTLDRSLALVRLADLTIR